jgi:hypothetical protein
MRSFFGSLRRLATSQIAIDVYAFASGVLLTSAFFYVNWGMSMFFYFRLLTLVQAHVPIAF